MGSSPYAGPTACVGYVLGEVLQGAVRGLRIRRYVNKRNESQMDTLEG